MVDGGAFGAFLEQLSQAGFFAYVLPFLLIFSLVYGILLKVKVFEQNKTINGVIALAVGLMALQFDFVPRFFSEIFPRIGVGLAVILALIIILGLFLPVNQTWVSYTLLGIGVVILWVVLSKSGLFEGATSVSIWWSQNWGWVIGLIALIIMITIIMRKGKPMTPQPKIPLLQPFWGGVDKVTE